MKKCILAAVFVFSMIATTCVAAETAPQPKWMTSPVKEWVDKARATTQQVTIKDLKDAIDSGKEMVILDVREPNEYEVAHIPEAINVPRGLLEFSIWTVVPNKEEKIFVYCKTGARAALATKLLNELGYKNAVAVNTGGVAWVQAGYPIKTSITDEDVVIIPAKR
ncbi:rhodanese-like domain-containing protein [uncultured Desulfobulbus sp.]|uniref:rhodanese-like domain-containing protein n=1 Tax=uncultured Desulfobulbus sp. TaxID=239745 RepID=UPI0029C755FB|nr:rhodanese-like domain-containing protein [uncultured Desulfobulbus sp.]